LRKQRLELLVWSFVLSLAYYPEHFGFLAWFALVRPIIIIARLQGRRAFTAAYFYGFAFAAFSLYWIWQVTPPGTITAVALVAIYYAVVLWLFNKLYRIRPVLGAIALPVLWVGMEYFRTLTEFAFPWSDLGYTQTYYLYILQIVSVLSVHGLSLFIAAVNVLLWQALRRELSPERRLTSVFVSAAIVLALLAYGWVAVPKYPEPGTREIVMLQGSVPLEVKWADGMEEHSFRLYDSLAQSIADTLPDSVVPMYVWPETSAPTYLSHYINHRRRVGDIARRSGGYHLVGAMGAGWKEGDQRYYNSCYLVEPDGEMRARYDKIKLVPFTEQVPYQESLPFLRKEFLEKYLTFIKTYNVRWWSDYYPGDSIVLFEMPAYEFGVLICFESTFPEFCREMINRGADMVIGITNDTWFRRSVGVHMHSRIFLTRMVENRCWGVRVANSGLSYIVDGYGRIREGIGLYEVTAVHGRAGLLEDKSLFTRWGDITGRAAFLLLSVTIVILLLRWIIGVLAHGRSR
jgi:apolipoprotein N-acyltransferase